MKSIRSLLLIATAAAALGLTACGRVDAEAAVQQTPEGFTLLSYDQGNGLQPTLYVYEHNETKVKYVVVRSSGVAITPLVEK